MKQLFKITSYLLLIFIINSSFSYFKNYDYGKNVFVKIVTDPSINGTLYVSLVNEKNQDLQFYMFDLEGQLIDNFVLKNTKAKRIDKLHKGIYMYDVFKQDESIERGSIEIK